MPRSHKDPPVFSKDKPYARWKTEVNLWADMVKANTTVVEDTIGQVVALNSLPDTEAEGDIRGKVIDALGDDLKGKDGLKKLLKWMDEHMGRDAIQSCVDKASAFMKYRRTENQNMKEYLAGFDAKYKAAVSAGLGDMGQIFLMYMVVENAGVTEQQFQLVLSQIDLESKETLYTDAKQGLTKFFAGINFGNSNKEEGYRLKENATFFAKRTWRPQTPYQPRFPIRGAAGGGPSGHTPGFGGAGAFGGGNPRSFTPRTTVNVPRNPIKNGKQEVCDICGAFTHYRRDCVYNPVNAAMIGALEQEDPGAYLYHDDHVYISDQPLILNEEDKQPAESGDQNAVDHVATLIASLSSKKEGPEEEVAVLLNYNTDFMDQGFGQIVLDTGCVKSVGSTKKLNAFINTLHPATRQKIRIESSNRVFKFGGGQKRKSVGTFYIPCSLNNKNLILVMDAVEQDDLPCLLSKESMKKAGVNIDVVNDTAVFFGETIKLKENKAGHYVITLGDYDYGEEECAVMWSGEGDPEQMMEDLTKMHRGLGHPSQKTFERMLKFDGSFNKNVHDLVNKLYQNCLTCHKHKKAKSTPKVSPSLSQTVNDTITLDLKLFPKKGRHVLYMIDDFSRFVKTAIINNKEGDTIVKNFLDKWVFGTPYGPPRQVHTDNGTEFVNAVFREMTERFGIKHTTTGAHSPFSNGLNERNHHTVDLMVEKIMDSDKSISFEDALSKAVYAKNTMLNVHGFSPAQILTGRQPRLPGATNNNRPPQDEVDITSKHVYDEIKMMDTARDAWLKVDTGRRLKEAMQVRPSPLEHYAPGTPVYYRFGRDPRWHGPGKVVGQDNKVILIRHGGHVISTSQTRVFKSPTHPEQMASTSADSQARAETGERAESPTVPDRAETESDSDSDSDWGDAPAPAAQPRLPAGQAEGLREEEGSERAELEGNQNDPVQAEERPETSPEAGTGREVFQFRPDQLQTQPSEDNSEQGNEADNMEEELVIRKKSLPAKGKKILPKKGNFILYKNRDSDTWFRAQVIQKAVKATNPLPYYNVKAEFDNQAKGINLDEFDWVFDSPESCKGKEIYAGENRRSPKAGASPRLKKREEHNVLFTTNYAAYEHCDQIQRAEKAEKMNKSYVVFIPKQDWDKPFVVEAKEKEINNFLRYGAYKEVGDMGQPRMSSGWVITEKCYGDVIGAKARLVVHGNQEGYTGSCDSPTVSKQSLRIQFTLAAQFGWELVMADITSAFLQSDVLDREVYVQPPKGTAKPGIIWKLVKPMYGLGDASLKWYKTLASKLVQLGCQRMGLDPAMFYWHGKDGQLGGLLSWHVDDMVACGSEDFYKQVLSPLLNTFNFGSTSEGEYRCLGWNVVHREGDILVSQKDYITTKIEYLDIDYRGKDGSEKLSMEMASLVRAAIGKLRWLADQCRPDIAYNLLELSIQAHEPTYDTVKLVNKTMLRVKHSEYEIRYTRLKKKDWHISVFTDASLRGLPDKTSSAMGFIILLSDGFKPGSKNKANVLTWKSCKTKRIVASTYDAETLALTGGLEEAIFLRDQMAKLLNIQEKEIKIEVFCDCNDTVEAILANKPLPNKNSRLAALEIARVQEMRQLGMIQDIYWIPSRLQLADSFTKRGVNNEPLVDTLRDGRFSL